jgi:urease accessory protein UreH
VIGGHVDAVRARLDAIAPRAAHAVTLAGDARDVLVCRVLATEAEDIRRAFVPVWTLLREALTGSAPAIPRVWAT